MIACMFLHSFIFHFYALFSSSLDLGDVEASLHGSPAVLSIPILQPCLRSEQLLITNEDQSRLVHLVTQLRYWITKKRVHKTLQQLPATSYESLPILFDLVIVIFISLIFLIGRASFAHLQMTLILTII